MHFASRHYTKREVENDPSIHLQMADSVKAQKDYCLFIFENVDYE